MKYSRKALDEAYETLDWMQKKVLDDYVIRGLKTKWLNTWIKQLGQEVEEEADVDEAMQSFLEWVFVDYKDYGTVRKDITCECGRKLRYRYTIRNRLNGKEYKLGAIHFQEHTGIEPETARLVLKEFKEIDLEKDEILSKWIEKWKLPFDLPEGMTPPEDMRAQLRVGLPLLDRQVQRLFPMVREYQKVQRQNTINQLMTQMNPLKLVTEFEERAYAYSIEELQVIYEYIKEKPLAIEEAGMTKA